VLKIFCNVLYQTIVDELGNVISAVDLDLDNLSESISLFYEIRSSCVVLDKIRGFTFKVNTEPTWSILCLQFEYNNFVIKITAIFSLFLDFLSALCKTLISPHQGQQIYF